MFGDAGSRWYNFRDSDVARFVWYCPNSVLLPTGGLDRENEPLTIGGYE